MSEAASDVREFLDAHPSEVLVFVIEDYVPPERLKDVFDAAGLGGMLLAVDDGGPLAHARRDDPDRHSGSW